MVNYTPLQFSWQFESDGQKKKGSVMSKGNHVCTTELPRGKEENWRLGQPTRSYKPLNDQSSTQANTYKLWARRVIVYKNHIVDVWSWEGQPTLIYCWVCSWSEDWKALIKRTGGHRGQKPMLLHAFSHCPENEPTNWLDSWERLKTSPRLMWHPGTMVCMQTF